MNCKVLWPIKAQACISPVLYSLRLIRTAKTFWEDFAPVLLVKHFQTLPRRCSLALRPFITFEALEVRTRQRAAKFTP